MSHAPSLHFQTSLDNNMLNYFPPKDKNKTPLNLRYLNNKFCPFQKYVDHRPYPYRPLTNSTSNTNLFNHPIDKEKYVSCFRNMNKKKLYPLITRSDLAKYLKLDGTLLRHQTPCSACNRINRGNYGRNYYSLIKKSFPFVKGNFCGNLTKFFLRNNTPSNSRNQTDRFKNRFFNNINDKYDNNFNTDEKNLSQNKFKKIYDMDKKEESKNEKNDDFNNNEFMNENENKRYKFISRNASANYFYRPVIKKTFHKTQIFDHCKPYLVDTFKEYGTYK